MNNTQLQLRCASSDPDISGLGVRISFYLQSFLLVILVDRSWEEAPTALWTFIATSFGLTIAAIIQFRKQQLLLIEALQVSNLVWLANFGTFVALASYSRHKRDSRRKRGAKTSKHERSRKSNYEVKTAAMVQTLLSMALTVYMWATAETFGYPHCASVLHYVLFVWHIPIHRSGRVVGLTFSILLTCAYIIVTLHEYWISYQKRKSKLKKKKDDGPSLLSVPLPSSPALSSPSPSVNRAQDTYQMPSPRILEQSSSRPRPPRATWSQVDPMFTGILIFETFVFLYFIVSNEILLRDNHADSVDSFGFGQILALVVILPVLLSVIGAFRESGLRPRHRRAGGSKRQFRPKKRSQHEGDLPV